MSILSKLGEAAQAAGIKAGEAIEVGKLKVKIQAEKAAIDKVKTQMGHLLWQDYEAGKTLEPQQEALCEQIKDSLAAIDILNTAIDTLRGVDTPRGEGCCGRHGEGHGEGSCGCDRHGESEGHNSEDSCDCEGHGEGSCGCGGHGEDSQG